ncbi:MAG TPA: hypothetical protein VGO96_08040 [Pyrinomonadaceae bacterium]|nr:hypothetical protein [Pyrinomonadaceae bacterium]
MADALYHFSAPLLLWWRRRPGLRQPETCTGTLPAHIFLIVTFLIRGNADSFIIASPVAH